MPADEFKVLAKYFYINYPTSFVKALLKDVNRDVNSGPKTPMHILLTSDQDLAKHYLEVLKELGIEITFSNIISSGNKNILEKKPPSQNLNPKPTTNHIGGSASFLKPQPLLIYKNKMILIIIDQINLEDLVYDLF